MDENLEQEERITEYEQVREEFRQTSKLTNRRVARGITVIGFIIAYALLAPNGLLFITVVPIVLAILLIMSLQSGIILRLLGERSYVIEQSIQNIKWEHFLDDFRKEMEWERIPTITWVWFPAFIVYMLSGVIYIGSIIISLVLLFDEFGVILTLVGGVAYLILTILVGLSVLSYYKVIQKVQEFHED